MTSLNSSNSPNQLDQFYTTPYYAQRCYGKLLACLPRDLARAADFIDPSAGNGAFYDLLPAGRRTGVDVAPALSHSAIKQADFLAWKPKRGAKTHRIVIGNPPFGKRGNLALQFLTHASTMADTIAFIVPMCFRKYAVHRKLPSDLRLITQMDLPRDAFYLPYAGRASRATHSKPYQVKTEFQIWSRVLAGKDLRRLEAEPIRHPDFVLHQYNNTKEALPVFDLTFDFAVPCQGWQDYGRRETDPNNCERNKQWMLFYALDANTQRKLRDLDYHGLAYQVATAIPGFRKCDVVEAYQNRGKTL